MNSSQNSLSTYLLRFLACWAPISFVISCFPVSSSLFFSFVFSCSCSFKPWRFFSISQASAGQVSASESEAVMDKELPATTEPTQEVFYRQCEPKELPLNTCKKILFTRRCWTGVALQHSMMASKKWANSGPRQMKPRTQPRDTEAVSSANSALISLGSCCKLNPQVIAMWLGNWFRADLHTNAHLCCPMNGQSPKTWISS